MKVFRITNRKIHVSVLLLANDDLEAMDIFVEFYSDEYEDVSRVYRNGNYILSCYNTYGEIIDFYCELVRDTKGIIQ